MQKVAATVAALFFVFVLWIVYLANTGSESVIFDLVGAVPYGDKVGHFCLFGFLTLVLVIATKYRSFELGRFSIYYGALLVFVFVALEEFSQHFISTRTFDMVDLLADGLGIASVSLVLAVSKRRVREC